MTVLMPAPAAPLVLPRIGVLLRHAAPRVFESMILPVLVFYVALVFTSANGALAVAAAWVYGGVAWRLVRGGEAPGTLLLAAGTITVRVVLTVATGNPIVFFLQPCLGVFCVSMGFLLTAPLQRPLIQRVVADLVPLPDQVMEHPRMRRFFVSQSVLWGCAQLLNGALSLWLLLSQTLETYLLVRTSAVAVLLGGVALVSVLSLRHCLRRLETRGAENPEPPTPDLEARAL
ncbi:MULTISPECIES: VC0807 family protein [unclassified Streptosporangium]|uniref:VC0807 family protein n=1 Tax=unclassified Streptosporangium TaxID=2632669 RepID=UPI002E27CDE7|nr:MULTISPECIES: VC0807 family protein [unclassified Streptosporangium]